MDGDKWNRFWFITFCWMAPGLQYIHAQPDSLLEITKVTNLIFDGQVNEAFWDEIKPVPLIQYSPNTGAPPTEKTEIRFAYDDHYFYGSIRAFDSEPDKIRGNSLYRDRLAGSDHFEILLDSYNDNETAFIFNTISTGVRTDALIANDATGGTISSSAWFNGDFNTFWDTKVSRDDQGWYAETRIPFSSLRFENVDGDVIMGLSVQRKIARKLERLVFPNIRPEIDWAFLKPSLAQKILIKGIQPTKAVYITPYLLTGHIHQNVLNESQSAYESLDDVPIDIGGDIKFSVTNNLTLDFTVNTDFAQVEADDQQINLSRFSLFFPEKRQFFQERSGIFEFRTGGQSRLFFSRQIGLSNSGVPLPIIGGVRLVGRSKNWDIGILDMQTRSFEDFNSENFGVLRVRRRAFNDLSTVGGMFTSRIGQDGRKNIAYGFDGLINVSGDDFLTANWSQTFESNTENKNNGRLTLEMNRRRRLGFGYNLGFIYSGKGYTPRLGFIDRRNITFGTATVSQTWLHPEGHKFINQSIELTGNTFFDNDTDDLSTAFIQSKWQFSTRSQDVGNIQFEWNYENLPMPLTLSGGVEIPAGVYRFARAGIGYRMAGEKIIRTGITYETGAFYDGWLHTISLSPSWFVSKHLELGLNYALNNLQFDARDESRTIHVARLRIGTAVNSLLSTNAFLQFSSSQDLFSANIRFRYNFREGNDLWLVFNQGLNTDRISRMPELPRVATSSILFKYLHTFVYAN